MSVSFARRCRTTLRLWSFHALAAFGVTVRTETDLSALSERLVLAVQETMQPEHVSLWLRPLEHRA